MSKTDCNYQRKITTAELTSALAEAECRHCRASATELMLKGELLEVCGEEFGSDIVSGERVLVPIALCPSCHAKHHLDANSRHNPCQIKARHSREQLA